MHRNELLLPCCISEFNKAKGLGGTTISPPPSLTQSFDFTVPNYERLLQSFYASGRTLRIGASFVAPSPECKNTRLPLRRRYMAPLLVPLARGDQTSAGPPVVFCAL